MLKKIAFFVFLFCSLFSFADEKPPRLAIVPGGEPEPVELLTLAEAKLFGRHDVEMVERSEIDKILAEQKRSGLFETENALQLGKILRADLFAVLEPMSIVVFDAKTGLRYADETLPENPEKAANAVAGAVGQAREKRGKLKDGKLETFAVLEIRNADFPVERDAWCKAVAGMLERQLLRNGAAVLERSRLGQVNRERKLTGDDSNDLLASMKLIDLEFSRGEKPRTFRLTARIGEKVYRAESLLDKPLDSVRELARALTSSDVGAEPEAPGRPAPR